MNPKNKLRRLPDMNNKERDRILASFERRLMELRGDMDAIYKETKLRAIRRGIAES